MFFHKLIYPDWSEPYNGNEVTMPKYYERYNTGKSKPKKKKKKKSVLTRKRKTILTGGY